MKRKYPKPEKVSIVKNRGRNGVKGTLEEHGPYRAIYYYRKKKFESTGEAGMMPQGKFNFYLVYGQSKHDYSALRKMIAEASKQG